MEEALPSEHHQGTPTSGPWRRVVGFIGRRSRVGAVRVKHSSWKVIQITICAVGAYWIAEQILGHTAPLFAATSAMLALGFSHDSHLRRTLEVALGCTLGILIGDVLLALLGGGVWQAAVVVALSLTMARFLDEGVLFSTQLGLQSLLVVLLPAPDGGVFGRSLDAIVGGALALLVVAVTPRNPRLVPADRLRMVLEDLGGVLRESATAVRGLDSTLAWHALVRARGMQAAVDALPSMLEGAHEIATLSPAYRRQRSELRRLKRVAEYSDLALRSMRSIVRRVASAITHGAVNEHDAEVLSAAMDGISDALLHLQRSVTETTAATRLAAERTARQELASCASGLSPEEFGVSGVECQSLVMMLRPMVVDLLIAAGATREEAMGYLPRV